MRRCTFALGPLAASLVAGADPRPAGSLPALPQPRGEAPVPRRPVMKAPTVLYLDPTVEP